MLDKIVIMSCNKEAFMVYTNRSVVRLYSDKDVSILIQWFLNDTRAHITTNGMVVTGLELRRECSDEITLIVKDGAA